MNKTRAIGKPRFIDPSLIDIGDDISVEHKADKGCVMTLRGIVGKLEYGGKTRYLLTEEGATLLAWDVDRKTNVRVTLYGRRDYPEEFVFEDFDMEAVS